MHAQSRGIVTSARSSRALFFSPSTPARSIPRKKRTGARSEASRPRVPPSPKESGHGQRLTSRRSPEDSRRRFALLPLEERWRESGRALGSPTESRPRLSSLEHGGSRSPQALPCKHSADRASRGSPRISTADPSERTRRGLPLTPGTRARGSGEHAREPRARDADLRPARCGPRCSSAVGHSFSSSLRSSRPTFLPMAPRPEPGSDSGREQDGKVSSQPGVSFRTAAKSPGMPLG